MSEITGKIHSVETCGTVDGPGIRFVVFMQGCPMRCLYCHNPDTWEIDAESSKKVTADELLEKYDGVKEFCKGGITVTGGEPLVQIDFITDLFIKAQNKGIHTALDTSGICFNSENTAKFDDLLKYTSLVLLDIKHIDEAEHIKLTKHSNKNILMFAKYLSDKNIPIWIRHVIVPSINDKEEYLSGLGRFISGLHSVKALDVLPYHDMAKTKYKNLGIEYPLKDIPVATKEDAIRARNIIVSAIKEALNNEHHLYNYNSEE